jgi:hypothetical protein
MHKNNITKRSFFSLFAFVLLLVPANLLAALPKPLNFVDQLAGLLPLFMLFGPLVAVVISTLGKVWHLKAKLPIPRKLHPLERLTIGALAQTIVEFIFLTLLWVLFEPAVREVLAVIGIKTVSPGVKVILYTAMILPWYAIMGTLSLFLFLQLVTSLSFAEIRQRYLKTCLFLSLVLPVLIILAIAVRILFFNPS